MPAIDEDSYPFYWGGVGLWGGGLYPNMMLPGYEGLEPESVTVAKAQDTHAKIEEAKHQNDDPHLRSCKSLIGYHIKASDGEVGHIQDFLVDEKSWAIRYLVVNTSNWWLGHAVLIAPQWIENMSWSDKLASVDLSQQAIKDAPPYNAMKQLDRDQEIAIYAHYGRLEN